ncbi:D-arabinono-1,4-lactone oxidase [Curtobacterium sp. MCJR17_043]|uniref:D-arabinono-1,4-lactone oxidase n=1 Tax=Curtobacterium sp. MCJR17_043 TaxID=2175660 RepID=UPI0024E03C8D|nr:D-arabinono-1,4-lactone oxidase [Curtobacterium sp. MCJR17_043]WIB37066.1 D-arabinono-1,4-lactone oxidase [Curtobacterium sp. MCJR17_043]
MRQDTYGPIAWDTFTAGAAEVFAAGYSVCAYTVFGDTVSEVLVKSRVPDGADDVAVPADLLGAPRLPGAPGDGHHTARDGSVGPWWDRLPHFPIDAVPSVGSEVQSEHFVPLRHAAAALDALRGLAHRIQPHLHVSELRTMAADDLWLSPTQGEDVLCIAFTWKKHPAEVAALLPDLEVRLAPFGGRPHWGEDELPRRHGGRGAVPTTAGLPRPGRDPRPGPEVRVRVRRAGARDLSRASREARGAAGASAAAT